MPLHHDFLTRRAFRPARLFRMFAEKAMGLAGGSRIHKKRDRRFRGDPVTNQGIGLIA